MAAIVLLTTWPWSDFQNHSHWGQVEWVPFTKYVRPFDMIANVALFAPFGAAVVWGDRSTRQVRLAIACGLGFSLAIELAQVYMHGHAPTVVDVVTNTIGAWVGARWATRQRRAIADVEES